MSLLAVGIALVSSNLNQKGRKRIDRLEEMDLGCNHGSRHRRSKRILLSLSLPA